MCNNCKIIDKENLLFISDVDNLEYILVMDKTEGTLIFNNRELNKEIVRRLYLDYPDHNALLHLEISNGIGKQDIPIGRLENPGLIENQLDRLNRLYSD
jgi:hypothetical protein